MNETKFSEFVFWAVIACIAALAFAFVILVTSKRAAAGPKKAAEVAVLESAFNVHPGMKMSKDVPGVGNRLFTYERTKALGNGRYAIIVTMQRW